MRAGECSQQAPEVNDRSRALPKSENNEAPSRTAQWVFRNRRGLVLVAALVAGVGMLVEDSSWIGNAQAWPWVMGGALVVIMYGVGIRFWATIHIGGRKSATVVDTGPYAWSRNPLYLGSLACVLGIGALSGSVIASLVGLVALATIYGLTIRHEEQRLLATLGEAYREYMKRVPRFMARGVSAPKSSNRREDEAGETQSVEPRFLWREAYTALGFVLAGGAAIGLRLWVASLHASETLPVLVRW